MVHLEVSDVKTIKKKGTNNSRKICLGSLVVFIARCWMGNNYEKGGAIGKRENATEGAA